ncbi:MAG: AbrB/MazE/SpoVT family DNA-binding domain-containing protein [Christensenellales bacterium]|nr:AbrB/MazE/SpoVT family DNA-binding domain-containing protein [Christensenellales bacterium]
MKSVIGIGGIHLPSGKHVLGMKKARHIFGTAKVGDRGQIVIPKDAREFYGIHPGDTLLILGDEENGMIVTKPEVLSSLAEKILDQIGKEERANP